jgi:dolichol-phosphate mannosyltransferase
VQFDAIGYKMLLEILVKAKGVRIREIPYTFTNRRAGASKVDASVVYDYLRAVLRLYRYGRSSSSERRTSVRFLSKAGRFYTIGAAGLLVNYGVSALLGFMFPGLWYIYGTVAGIVLSITSNFFLNKIWTFEDRDFGGRRTAKQFGMFFGRLTVWMITYCRSCLPLPQPLSPTFCSTRDGLLGKRFGASCVKESCVRALTCLSTMHVFF